MNDKNIQPVCVFCGKELDPKAPDVVWSKQKKPGGKIYAHSHCVESPKKEETE